jgi:hypothetical protein
MFGFVLLAVPKANMPVCFCSNDPWPAVVSQKSTSFVVGPGGGGGGVVSVPPAELFEQEQANKNIPRNMVITGVIRLFRFML